jgi:hypothetical protein
MWFKNGLRTLRHHKDMPAKIEHPFIRVSGCPNRFWLAKRLRVLEQWNISIVAMVNHGINAS